MKLLSFCLFSAPLKNRWLHVSAVRVKQEKFEELDKRWLEPSGFTTEIHVYNPIVKRKVPLILRNKGYATWYMCGPTVYDSAHIGHACSYVKLDVIRRILSTYFDINLVTTMGITDIDDKIIKRSRDIKKDWKELTRFYETEFFNDMDALNVLRPHICSRVSEHLPQIIKFVDKILNNGGAYVENDGSVYFDTSKYESYGKFGNKEPNSPCVGKRNVSDFALWKSAKAGEPFWESPWGPGRPGWHIECSTMASEKLGVNIDIHSGGIDLAFPHHENEEAQSCQHHGISQWVNYWLHTGHLHANRTKMSKSLGNTVTVSELLVKYTSDEFRLFCLFSHYRSGVEYTDQSIEASVTILKKIQSFLDDCDNYVNGTLPVEGNVDEVLIEQNLVETKNIVRAALADDFDTPKVIRTVTSLVALGNKMLHSPADEIKVRNPAAIAALSNYITSILKSFGMEINIKSTKQISVRTLDVIESFVKFRGDVRNIAMESEPKDNKLLQVCDGARNDLSLHGVKIKDYKGNSTWSIVESSNKTNV